MDLRARADADRWMDWASLEAVAVMEVLRSAYRAPSERRDPAVIAEATAKAAQVWSILDRVLADRPYVAGDELRQIAPVEKPPLPALAAWYERLKARPAFAQHIAARVQYLPDRHNEQLKSARSRWYAKLHSVASRFNFGSEHIAT